MNKSFIELTVENIFSNAIPVSDTFFDMGGVSIVLPSTGISGSDSKIVCKYALELSWVFRMVLNIYYDELNDQNKFGLINLMAKEANYYVKKDFPKEAVLLSVMRAGEIWFKKNFPHKAAIFVEEKWGSDVLLD